MKIEKMVNKKILALQDDVQREALLSLAQKEAEKYAAAQELTKQRALAKKMVSNKTFVRLDTKPIARSEGNRNNNALYKKQAERSARLSYSKPVQIAGQTSRGKENKASKVKPPPKVELFCNVI